MKPLAIDLYCGLGGWTEGLLAEGYHVVGFDIERHAYGEECYPAQLVLQDVLSIDGRQFKDAALIVASPPCQAYSYRAMPWKRARALPPPDNALFEACFRIQREACAAAGRPIPLVVENVKGAQKWVGRARWNFGSFYLWGDVPALMPMVRRAIKNQGGSWFAQAYNTTSGVGQNPDGRKVPGQNWSRYGKTGEVSPHWRMEAIKVGDQNEYRRSGTPSPHFTSPEEGVKASAPGHHRHPGSGPDWFDMGPSQFHSKSVGRKHASARIAKIPLTLSRYIARTYFPESHERQAV